MRRVAHLALLFTATLLPSVASAQQPSSDFWKAAGDHGAVVAGSAEAADAALVVLKSGGNAVDAAVAAMLVLSVTDSNNFCFGGEVPIIIYDAQRDVVEVVSGQGAAPRLATVDYFEQHKDGRIPGGGDPTTAAVPGALDAYLTSLDRYGTMTFTELVQPTLAILDGHKKDWHANLAKTVRRLVDAEKTSPDDRLRGLRRVAACFYRGSIAWELDAWSRANGGLIRYTDLATHVTRIEDPLTLKYRGRTVYKCGPWTQGPSLLQTLQLLEPFDLAAMGHNRADYIHVLVEAMKLALADRDAHYADPLFVNVPLEQLLDPKYADLRRTLIDMNSVSRQQRPGDPVAGKPLLGKIPREYRPLNEPIHDTTNCIVADRFGNVVAATPSGWGGVLAGETGVVLNSRLRSLNTWRGHPNCIEPGKRPRITLTPSMVFDRGKPVVAASVVGGDLQDQVMLQILLNHIEFDFAPDKAVTAPRFSTAHHDGSFNQPPAELGSLSIYESVGTETIEALKALGHDVTIAKPPMGYPVMITIDPRTGQKQAAGDPTARRHARAY